MDRQPSNLKRSVEAFMESNIFRQENILADLSNCFCENLCACKLLKALSVGIQTARAYFIYFRMIHLKYKFDKLSDNMEL